MKNNDRKEAPVHDVDRSRKIIQLVCSILVAIGVWFYVGEEKTVSVTTSVHDLPVEFSGEDTTLADNGLMLLSGYDTTVDLTLRGPRKVLWKLDKDEIRIVADTSSIQDTGIQTLSYQVVYPDNIQRSQVQVEKASLYAITVTVGELYTKKVPIYCEISGKVADGYLSEEIMLDPTELVLRAQRDDLLDISYAKVHFNISNAKETVIKTVEFQLYDYNDIPVENPNIRAATKLIQVTMPVKTVKDVPLLINFVEATGSTMAQVDYSIDPKKVRLKGDKAALEHISSIVLDTIYLQDLQDYQTLKYKIPVPEDTQLVGDTEEVTVTIVVEGVSERRITSSNFTCTNVPEGFEAAVVTEQLAVTLRGLSASVDALTGGDLQITADLSGITGEGSFTVPVSIRIEGHSDVGVKGSYQVIVNVVVAQPEPDPGPDPEVDPAAMTRELPVDDASSEEPETTQEQVDNT